MCVGMGLYFSMPQAASETRGKGKKIKVTSKKKKKNKILTASRKHYF